MKIRYALPIPTVHEPTIRISLSPTTGHSSIFELYHLAFHRTLQALGCGLQALR